MLKKPDPDLQYLLWLTEVAALSPVKGVRLLGAFGSAKAVWQASLQQQEKCVKLEESEKNRLQNRSLALPNQILGRCDLLNVQILTITQPEYPDRLRNIYDPPLVLYVRGKLPDLNALPAIAVVGQRKATPYGRIVTERLGFQLSCSGVVVVSGMAAGIDASAHTGALKGPTPTVAVFGTAIDQCYPSYHAALMRNILYSGAVISEYPPGKKTYASAGCNELIVRGAKLVRSACDILEDYAGLYDFRTEDQPDLPRPEPEPQPVKRSRPQETEAAPAPTLDTVWQQDEQPETDPVLAALEGIVHLDDISQKTGLDTAALLAKLTLLELKGKVRQLPGQFYEKT